MPEFYADDGMSFLNLRFENDVKMYGTQTLVFPDRLLFQFKNDAKNVTMTNGFKKFIPHLWGEKRWVFNIGKIPYNISVSEVRAI